MFLNLLSIFYFYLRPILKWFLQLFTRLCELQRICYGVTDGAARIKGIEKSLEQSRSPDIISLRKILDNDVKQLMTEKQFQHTIVYKATTRIMEIKNIKSQSHPDFYGLFWDCAEMIWGYKYLYHRVESLRMIPYECNNLDHEQKLSDLWRLLMPNVKLESRITKQWQDIGFQGDDPKTDFRGMGMLGLENLLFFAREYNGAARHVLSHSLHPKHGYTFAIVGINLTSMAYNLLKNGAAKTHIYNVSRRFPTINTFHILYCYLFYQFDKYWMQCKPSSIMEFSYIQEKFQSHLLQQLADDKTYFKINLAVEDI